MNSNIDLASRAAALLFDTNELIYLRPCRYRSVLACSLFTTMLSLHSIHSDFQYGDTLALVIKLYISHFRSQRHMNTASGRIRFFCGYLVEKCCNSCLSSVLGIFRLQLFNFILKILCIFKFNLSSSVIDRLKEGSVTLNGLDCRVDTFARLPRDWL